MTRPQHAVRSNDKTLPGSTGYSLNGIKYVTFTKFRGEDELTGMTVHEEGRKSNRIYCTMAVSKTNTA